MPNNQNFAYNTNNIYNQSSNPNMYSNKTDFKEASIKLLLSDLRKKGIIQNDQEERLLYEAYMKRTEELNIVFDELKNLKREDVIKQIANEKAKEKEPNKIKLENIMDFTRDDVKKDYISIHYPYPSEQIKVVENRSGRSAKEIFEAVKDDSGYVTVDGFVNSLDVYENTLEKTHSEIPMKNVTELCKRGEFSKLTKEQKENVIGLVSVIVKELSGLDENQKKKLSQMPVEELVKLLDRDVYLNPEENIVMICIPNEPSKDQAMTVTKDKDGNYKLTSLNAKGLEYVNNISEEGEEYSNEEYDKAKEEMGPSLTLKKKKEKPKNNIAA